MGSVRRNCRRRAVGPKAGISTGFDLRQSRFVRLWVWPVKRIDVKEFLRLVPLPTPEVDTVLDDMMVDPVVRTHRGTIDEPTVCVMTSFIDAR